MTSNQIAAEGNRIQREIAQRQQDEINRHNAAVEQLDERRNQLTEESNQIQREWNEFQMRWKQDYEAKFKEYELAQEDQKIEIQEDLARMEEDKVYNDRMYKDRMSAYYDWLQANESERTKLQADFQEFQKSAKWQELGLTEKDQQIRRKQIEYDYAARHEQNLNTAAANEIAKQFNIARMDYNWASMNWEREKLNRMINRDITIASNTFDIQRLNYELSMQRYQEIDKKVAQSQMFQGYSSGLFGKSGIIPGTFDIVKTFIPVIGGISNVTTKTPKQIFDSLFTDNKF